jgi:lambda repressor-like predicted transcriptional regulator
MRLARSRVEKGLGAAAATQLSLHADALRLWGSRYLDELSSQFDEAWALQEGGMRLRADSAPAGLTATALSRDLELLQCWPHSVAASQPHDPSSSGPH